MAGVFAFKKDLFGSFFTFFDILYTYAEVADVSILDNVLFSFYTHLSSFACAGFAFVCFKIFVVNYLGTDECTFKICMNHSSGLRS